MIHYVLYPYYDKGFKDLPYTFLFQDVLASRISFISFCDIW
nr:MAG TPA: hypothetical protein [Caudoviricetes sp.]DAU59391.1 MAG TPA: hypothetical protein [Crassvirales sp.]